MLVVAVWAVPVVAEDAGDGWKAAKRREPKSSGESLAYRPSTEYDAPATPPKVVRAGEVTQTQFAAENNGSATERSAVATRGTARSTTRSSNAAPSRNDGTSQVIGTIARARNTKGQSSYVLLDAAGDPSHILLPDRRLNLAPHVGRQVRVRGVATAAGRSGRLPRLSIQAMSAVSARSGASAFGEIVPATLLQVPQNAETVAAAGQEEIPSDAATVDGPSDSPATEDVPPPRRVERLQPPQDDSQAMPMPEEIHPGEGAEDGEVYYAPGEFDDGEMIVEGPVVGPAGRYGPYGRQHYGGPLERLLGRIHGAWVRADYLLWSTEGMDLPPLVTTSPTGTPRSMAGVLGEDGTSVLYGDSTIFDDSRSGARLRAGVWFDPCHIWGLEGEYLALEDLSDNYRAASSGDPILARPFFDPLAGQETSQLVAFPNVINGEVEVDAMTRFQSAGARLRLNACQQTFACDPCARVALAQPVAASGEVGFWDNEWRSSGLPGANYDFNQSSYRLDILGGYRYLLLDDQLRIQEDLTSLDTTTPGTFDITDAFDAENRFNGGEIGLLFEIQRRRWSLELLTKIALGTTQQAVTINGTTTSDEAGDVVTDPGGLLAQRTNIGMHEQNVFTAVPELGVTLGYQLTRHTKLTVGYTLIYWSSVVRAGDQIDLDVNPNLLPPEVVPFAGPERPRFDFVESDYWAHGLTAGVDVRW
jgi:hypothetical protein